MLPILILSAILVSAVNSAKILGAFITPSYSHQIFFQPIWKELSLRGHQVTVITPNPLNDSSLTNLTEIDVSYLYDTWAEVNKKTTTLSGGDNTNVMKKLIEGHIKLNDQVLADPRIQQIINDTDREYDLFLVEYLVSSMFGLKDRFKCPLIGLNSLGLSSITNEMIGNPFNPALEPEVFLQFSTDLTFWQRVHSTVSNILYKLIIKHYLFPRLNEIQDKYIGNYVRPVNEIAQDTSLVIANSNFALQNVRPVVPAYIEVPSLHVKSPKPLPKDLKTFFDNASDGVVYVSFGTNVNISTIPQEQLNTLLETFADFPYKFLWKFEVDHLPNKPDNVETRKWLPQQDILAHHNVKLFITQGGQQSIDEAIYYGVPTLVMPFFGDQFRNADRLVKLGVALSVNAHSIDKEILKMSIKELITNPQYKTNTDNLSKIVKDHQTSGLDKAIWWIEYVLRHNGAPHLRYKGIDMPFYQYFLLDVIAFVIVAFLVSLYVVYKVVRVCFRIFKRLFFTNICTAKSHTE